MGLKSVLLSLTYWTLILAVNYGAWGWGRWTWAWVLSPSKERRSSRPRSGLMLRWERDKGSCYIKRRLKWKPWNSRGWNCSARQSWKDIRWKQQKPFWKPTRDNHLVALALAPAQVPAQVGQLLLHHTLETVEVVLPKVDPLLVKHPGEEIASFQTPAQFMAKSRKFMSEGRKNHL